jgi:hypothetical protein
MDVVGACYRVHGSNQYIAAGFDLHQVRQTIVFMRATIWYIDQVARSLGLLDRGTVQSFSYVAMRMISYKLDPQRHPVQGERGARLVRSGAQALVGRGDVSTSVKLGLFVWLVAMAAGPRKVARPLAEQLMLPGRRPAWLNALLRSRHRRP